MIIRNINNLLIIQNIKHNNLMIIPNINNLMIIQIIYYYNINHKKII